MENENSKNIVPFCFGDNLVRVIRDAQGNPWFVAKDVCKVLEIEKYRDAVSRLDDDERGSELVDTLGGPQEMSTISESGLYALVFRSRKPEAKAFSKWVRSEVLPAIRKTGKYDTPGARKCRQFPDDLPEEARRVPPRLRQRIWQDAIQTARLDGGGSEEARQWFAWLCKLNGYGRADKGNNLIVAFMDECLVEEKGARAKASKIYEAFTNWWKAYGADGWLPSPKMLSQFLELRFSSKKSSVKVYCDCRIRNCGV